MSKYFPFFFAILAVTAFAYSDSDIKLEDLSGSSGIVKNFTNVNNLLIYLHKATNTKINIVNSANVSIYTGSSRNLTINYYNVQGINALSVSGAVVPSLQFINSSFISAEISNSSEVLVRTANTTSPLITLKNVERTTCQLQGMKSMGVIAKNSESIVVSLSASSGVLVSLTDCSNVNANLNIVNMMKLEAKGLQGSTIYGGVVHDSQFLLEDISNNFVQINASSQIGVNIYNSSSSYTGVDGQSTSVNILYEDVKNSSIVTLSGSETQINLECANDTNLTIKGGDLKSLTNITNCTIDEPALSQTPNSLPIIFPTNVTVEGTGNDTTLIIDGVPQKLNNITNNDNTTTTTTVITKNTTDTNSNKTDNATVKSNAVFMTMSGLFVSFFLVLAL